MFYLNLYIRKVLYLNFYFIVLILTSFFDIVPHVEFSIKHAFISLIKSQTIVTFKILFECKLLELFVAQISPSSSIN